MKLHAQGWESNARTKDDGYGLIETFNAEKMSAACRFIQLSII
jgi:hypothetical protein